MKFVKKIKPFYKDERGEMSYIVDKEIPFTSALYVTCKKGAVRANHYHKKDTHYVLLLKGKMEYTYAMDDEEPKTVVVNEGEVIESPPYMKHAMKFLKDSIFIALTTEPRDQKKYEKDTVRIKVI